MRRRKRRRGRDAGAGGIMRRWRTRSGSRETLSAPRRRRWRRWRSLHDWAPGDASPMAGPSILEWGDAWYAENGSGQPGCDNACATHPTCPGYAYYTMVPFLYDLGKAGLRKVRDGPPTSVMRTPESPRRCSTGLPMGATQKVLVARNSPCAATRGALLAQLARWEEKRGRVRIGRGQLLNL